MIVQVKDKILIDVVVDLAAEIWTEHFTPIIGSAQVEYMLNKFQSFQAVSNQIEDNILYYLLKTNGQYVGYFAIEFKKDYLFLSKFYIKSPQRGKGLGKSALAFIEETAVNNGLKRIALAVNKYNKITINIYRSLGFTIKDSVVTDIGSGFVMDDFLFEKVFP